MDVIHVLLVRRARLEERLNGRCLLDQTREQRWAPCTHMPTAAPTYWAEPPAPASPAHTTRTRATATTPAATIAPALHLGRHALEARHLGPAPLPREGQ